MSGNGNFYALLRRRFLEAGERPAFSPRGGDPVSYRQLDDLASVYAGGLLSLGVRPGDRVTVQVRKSLANVALYLGTLKAGAVYQPLNTAYTRSEVEFFVSDAEPSLIVVDPQMQDTVETLARGCGSPSVATLDGSGSGSMSEAAASAAPLRETVAMNSGDLAALIYTSGTTGRSKGAMITHHNIATNALALCDIWQMSRDDVLLHVRPIFHVHGLFVALHTAFLSSARILWHESFSPAEAIAALSDATVMMGVPTHYTRMMEAGGLTPQGLPLYARLHLGLCSSSAGDARPIRGGNRPQNS